MSRNQENASEKESPAVAPEVLAIPRTRVLPPALLLLVFLVVCGVGFLADPALRLVWALVLVFVGFMFAAQAFTLVLLPQTLTLTEEGIVPASGGLVPWADRAEIGTGEFPGTRPIPCIGLRLANAQRYDASLKARRRPFLKDWLRTAPTTNTANGRPAPTDSDTVVLIPRRRSADRPLIPVTRRRPYDLAWSKQALPDTPDSTVERICEYARRVARAQP